MKIKSYKELGVQKVVEISVTLGTYNDGTLLHHNCKHCWNLWTMPDKITPRLYKMSELAATPGNDWKNPNASVSVSHPNCFTGDQILFTDRGMLRFSDFVNTKPLVAVDNRVIKSDKYKDCVWIDRHIHGIKFKNSLPIIETGIQECVEIVLSNGQALKVSSGHECWVDDDNVGKRVLANQIQIGDKMMINTDESGFGEDSWEDLAELMGNCLGDGCFDGELAVWAFFGQDIPYGQKLYQMAKAISVAHAKSGTNFNDKMTIVPPDAKYNVSRARFNSLVLGNIFCDLKFDKINNPVIDKLFISDKKTIAAFLRGLYSADGHIEAPLNGVSIVIGQTNRTTLERCQILLSNFGIQSRIFLHENASTREFKNKSGLVKCFNTQQNFRLVIAGKLNCQNFLSNIGFGIQEKRDKLNKILEKVSIGRTSWRTARVVERKNIGLQKTYCLVEPETNTVTVNGIVTGQCRDLLTFLMPSFGFDTSGHIIYKGKDPDTGELWDEYKKQRGLR